MTESEFRTGIEKYVRRLNRHVKTNAWILIIIGFIFIGIILYDTFGGKPTPHSLLPSLVPFICFIAPGFTFLYLIGRDGRLIQISNNESVEMKYKRITDFLNDKRIAFRIGLKHYIEVRIKKFFFHAHELKFFYNANYYIIYARSVAIGGGNHGQGINLGGAYKTVRAFESFLNKHST